MSTQSNVPEVARRGLWSLSAGELAEGYRRGDFTPLDVVRDILGRIEDIDGKLNAFCFRDPDAVIEQAKASSERWQSGRSFGPLDGVPFSVKDNICVDGTPTLFGSPAFERHSAFAPDSPAVARLREAGAIVLGKTCLPDFAHKLTTDSPLTGVTRNPWDLSRSPGGSSGGAAAAVASGVGPVALGTDGGGSVRVPAAWVGIFGFKPSFGRVPHHPRGPFAILSHVGPMTRTALDSALVMNAITQPDARDWYSLPSEPRDYAEALQGSVRGLRVATSTRLGLTDVTVEREVIGALETAATLLESLGASVVPADPPHIDGLTEIHRTMWTTFSARVAKTLHGKRALLSPSFLELVEAGERLPRDAFTEAVILRGELATAVNSFFGSYDLVLCPAFPTLAPPAEDPPRLTPMFTCWCNQTGLPAATVPVSTSSSALPVAVQLVGGRFQDALVLRVSHALEKARGPFPWPPIG
jgi:aspartyl-tRNA(Asn)/glutamyl-tRNA(Gln) amidotransferase subunit A